MWFFSKAVGVTLCIAVIVPFITATDDHVDEGTCSVPPQQPDMVSRASLKEAFEKMKDIQVSLEIKDVQMKDIQSKLSGYKSAINELEEEKTRLADQLTEAEQKEAKVKQSYGQETEAESKKVWKFEVDLKHCNEDLGDFQRKSESWEKQRFEHRLEKPKMDNLLKKCQNDLKDCQTEQGKLEERIRQLTSQTDTQELEDAMSQLKEKNRDIKKLKEALGQMEDVKQKLLDCEKSKQKRTKKKMPEEEGIAREKYGFLTDKIKGMDDQGKSYTIPDVFDMDEAEGKQIFEEFRDDYNKMFEIALDADKSYIGCMKQRQDFTVMKYFLGKYLAQERMTSDGLRDEIEEALLDSELQTDLSDYVKKDEFDVIKKERDVCLSDIKELRKKYTANARDLKVSREELANIRRDVDDHKAKAKSCDSHLESLQMVERGSEMIIKEMEDDKKSKKKEIKKAKKKLEEAMAIADWYLLYLTLLLLASLTYGTYKAYDFIGGYVEKRLSEAKAIKKKEKEESKLKAKKRRTK